MRAIQQTQAGSFFDISLHRAVAERRKRHSWNLSEQMPKHQQRHNYRIPFTPQKQKPAPVKARAAVVGNARYSLMNITSLFSFAISKRISRSISLSEIFGSLKLMRRFFGFMSLINPQKPQRVKPIKQAFNSHELRAGHPENILAIW
jgi:hypothetical protein